MPAFQQYAKIYGPKSGSHSSHPETPSRIFSVPVSNTSSKVSCAPPAPTAAKPECHSHPNTQPPIITPTLENPASSKSLPGRHTRPDAPRLRSRVFSKVLVH